VIDKKEYQEKVDEIKDKRRGGASKEGKVIKKRRVSKVITKKNER
jgi:hypothetical protein